MRNKLRKAEFLESRILLIRSSIVSPVIDDLMVYPESVDAGERAWITATVPAQEGETIEYVDFYRDTNDNGYVDGGDELLGRGTEIADNLLWRLELDTMSLPTGNNRLLAQASNNFDRESNSASAYLEINRESDDSATILAFRQETMEGFVDAGDLDDVASSDDHHLVLLESRPNGSVLDHQWSFDVPYATGTATVVLEAFHEYDNETFYVNYSTDGDYWRNLFTVEAGAGEDNVLRRDLPADARGTVWLQAVDSNRNNDPMQNRLYVDQLVIEIEETNSYVAIDEETRLGAIYSGSYVLTHADDGDYEILVEDEAPHTRVSSLEHQWTFVVPDDESVTFEISAKRESHTDDFWVNYSTDGEYWQNMLTIDSDEAKTLTFALPDDVEGTVFVQVRDSDRTSDYVRDKFFVDYMAFVVD